VLARADIRKESGENEPLEEWMGSSGAGLGERVHEGSAVTDLVRSEKTSSDVLLPICVEQPRTPSVVANVCSIDREQLYSKDKLGCARSVLWALVFQVGMLMAIATYCTLHYLLR
jgi:hypothetical protein